MKGGTSGLKDSSVYVTLKKVLLIGEEDMRKNKGSPRSVPHRDFLLRDLKNPKACIGYLNAALEENDGDTFLIALHDVAEAQGGISRLAGLSKIHRVTLHRILSRQGNPKLENLVSILHALGLKLAVLPEKSHRLPRAA